MIVNHVDWTFFDADLKDWFVCLSKSTNIATSCNVIVSFRTFAVESDSVEILSLRALRVASASAIRKDIEELTLRTSLASTVD